jgi:serine/threonine-protein kinase
VGQGGMGAVWVAFQRSLEREVAVKVPRIGGDPLTTNALLKEARVAGNLEHPHIVPIHVLGVDSDGCPVLVMKRIEGQTLATLIEQEDHPAWPTLVERHGDRDGALLEVLMRVADALQFAHTKGIVHRDVKPENVMVGLFGEVYLLDWGIAHRIGQPTTEIVGTPGFLAPEMLDPALGPVDARTDVYLLGATLHAALTNTQRHVGSTLAEVFDAALHSAI